VYKIVSFADELFLINDLSHAHLDRLLGKLWEHFNEQVSYPKSS